MEAEYAQQVAMNTGAEAAIKDQMQPDAPLMHGSGQPNSWQIILEFQEVLDEIRHRLIGEEWMPDPDVPGKGSWQEIGAKVMNVSGARTIHSLLTMTFSPNVILSKMDDWEIRKMAHSVEHMLIRQLRNNYENWAALPENWAFIKQIVVRFGVFPALRRAQEGFTMKQMSTIHRETDITNRQFVPQRGGLINIGNTNGGY